MKSLLVLIIGLSSFLAHAQQKELTFLPEKGDYYLEKNGFDLINVTKSGQAIGSMKSALVCYGGYEGLADGRTISYLYDQYSNIYFLDEANSGTCQKIVQSMKDNLRAKFTFTVSGTSVIGVRREKVESPVKLDL